MSDTRIAVAMAGRSLRLITRMPSAFVPSLLMPLFLTIAFAGAFSGLVLLPRFPADKAIDWFIPMTTLQGSAFAGMTTGLGVARDLESGFYDRLLMSPASRRSLLAGPMLAAGLRALLPFTLLGVVAILADANLTSPFALVPLLVGAMGMALCASAWAIAIALRFKTMQAAPLMQTGIFLFLFLSTAQMPLELLTGWLRAVARVNPMTQILELARQGFLDGLSWGETWPGLVALAVLATLTISAASLAMRRVVP